MQQFGAHMSIAGGLEKAFDRGQKANCDVIQIFTKNGNQWHAKPITSESVELFKVHQAETAVRCVAAHTSYLINCASPKPDLFGKSQDALLEELQRADMLDIPYLVLHPGAHTGSGRDKGVRAIVRALNEVISATKKSRVRIALETTAGQGSSIGCAFQDLADIMAKVSVPERIVVCFDTCHVFAAGYDFRNRKSYDKTIKEFDTIIGTERIALFHINDSKKECGSRVDRHEHIGKGCIGKDGFRCIVQDVLFRDVPMILETPKGDDLKEDIQNLKLLRSFVK